MRRTSFGRRCSLETLEDRRLMAGDVFAQMVHGNLVIRGDDLANAIQVSAGPNPGDVVVTGLNDAGGVATRVNALSNVPVSFSGFTGQLQLDMRGGNDNVTATTLTSAGMVLDLGKGNDNLNFTNQTAHGSVLLRGGDGDENLFFQNTVVDGSVTVDLGQGNNQFVFRQGHVGGDAWFSAGRGNDSFTIDSGTIGGSATLNMGDGVNTLSLLQGVDGALTVRGGRGADNVTIGSPILGPFSFRSLSVGLGDGVNALVLNKITVTRPTTITSGKADDTFTSSAAVYGDFSADLGGGTNKFSFNSSTANGSFGYRGTNGNDTAEIISSKVTGTTGVSLGNGTNSINVKYSQFLDNVTILGGKGTDTAFLLQNHLFKTLNFDLGGGANNLFALILTVDSKALFRGGDGVDLFEIDQAHFAAVDISLGKSNDTLKVSENSSTQLTRFDGGVGIDSYLVGNFLTNNNFAEFNRTNFEIIGTYPYT